MVELNKVIHGDCLEVMKGITDKSIDLLLTDIPYNGVNRKSNGLRNLDKGNADVLDIPLNIIIEEFVRVTSGSGYVFCEWEQISEIINIIRQHNLSNRLCVWEKTNPSPMNGQHIWLSGAEFCVFFRNKNAVFNEKCKNVVWKYPNGRSKKHPTEKPLKLFEYLISVSSNESDIVLDPFAGSFTTAIACENLNRNWICIEKEEEYCKIGQERIEKTRDRK